MEMDHITLNGVTCETQGIVLLDIDLPDYSREIDSTLVPDQLEAVDDDRWQREPLEIPMVMAVVGSSMSDLQAKYQNARRWLLSGTRLGLSDFPGRFYRGNVIKIAKAESNASWIKFNVTFRANPGCEMRVLTPKAGFIPAGDEPIPAQITEENATCYAHFTEPSFLPEIAYAGADDAEVYIKAVGSWTKLSIGGALGLTVNLAVANDTVYIDCSHQEIYRSEDGQKVRMFGVTTGDFPAIRGGSASNLMLIGGEGLDVTVYVLAIERG